MNNDVPNQGLAGPDHSGRLHVQTHHEPETDSDTGTQMIKGPLCRNCDISISLKRGFNRALCFGIGDSHTFARRYAPSNVVLCLSRPLAPASLRRDAILHCSSNRLFLPQKSAIQDPRPVTVSILNRQRGRHMQGEWREA